MSVPERINLDRLAEITKLSINILIIIKTAGLMQHDLHQSQYSAAHLTAT